jgi:hypothetical protein
MITRSRDAPPATAAFAEGTGAGARARIIRASTGLPE